MTIENVHIKISNLANIYVPSLTHTPHTRIKATKQNIHDNRNDNEGFTINNFTKRNIFNNPHLQNVKANITGIDSKPFNGQNKNSYKSYFNQDM